MVSVFNNKWIESFWFNQMFEDDKKSCIYIEIGCHGGYTANFSWFTNFIEMVTDVIVWEWKNTIIGFLAEGTVKDEFGRLWELNEAADMESMEAWTDVGLWTVFNREDSSCESYTLIDIADVDKLVVWLLLLVADDT
jgi:hypothetical protein